MMTGVGNMAVTDDSNITVNITFLLREHKEDLKNLFSIEHHFLQFSYYAGYVVSSYNFIIFLLGVTLFIQVRERVK